MLSALRSALDVLRVLPHQVWTVQEEQLAPVLTLVDEVARLASAGLAVVTAEAVERGVVTERESPCWVHGHAPLLRTSGANGLAAFLRDTRPVGSTRRTRHLAPIRQAVLTGALSLAEGRAALTNLSRVTDRVHDQPGPPTEADLTSEQVAAMSEQQRLTWQRHLADAQHDVELLAALGRKETVMPSLWESVTARMVRAAPLGPRAVRDVPAQVLADLAPQTLEEQETRARRHRGLSVGYTAKDGVTEYRLVLDPEATAILEAAIGPLSAPQPADGQPDHRRVEQRRGDALITVVQTGVTHEHVPGRAKTQLLLTMHLGDLTGALSRHPRPHGPLHVDQPETMCGPLAGSGGVTLGGLETGTTLSAATIRRLACDAELIPAVLDAAGQVLDLGSTRRLFSTGQLLILYRRDHGCTFGGCTTPARWCDAHHLIHWADGGPTSLDNAALLCGRHHTIVHRRRLHGSYDTARHRVTWDTTTGSYDAYLDGRERPPPWQASPGEI